MANNRFDPRDSNRDYPRRRSHPLIDAILLIICIAGFILLCQIWIVGGMPIPFGY